MEMVLEELTQDELAALERYRKERDSDNEYTPWISEGITEADYFKRLYLEMSNELAALIAEVKKLKVHLSPDGEYAIRRADGGAMFITETMLLGDIMDNIDAMLEWDVTPKELSTPDPQ